MSILQSFEFRKITSFVIIGVFLFLAFGSSDEDEDDIINTEDDSIKMSIPLPPEQVSFSSLIDSMYNVYLEQPNELKKSSVKKARNNLFKTIKLERKVTNWIGILESMTTNDKGNASIEVSLLDSRAEIETADYPITLGTNLYEYISSLSNGDTVVVCGRFYPSPDYMGQYEYEYIYEHSYTESGSMENPEYYFKFKSVEKFPSSGQIVPDIKD